MEIIDKPSTIKIHFIIGSGRAGTTLLFHILNNHKNCVGCPESKHLLFFYEKHHDMKEVTVDLIKDTEHYFSIMLQAAGITNYSDYLNTELHFKLGEKINYFEFCRRIYFAFAYHKKDKSKITTIIDKNPAYTLQVDKLNKILPDAKYLCAVRDYRSYVLSTVQSPEPYAKHLPIQYHSLVWMFYNKLVLDLKNKYQSKVDFIRYEDFVTNKEKSFKEVCNFFAVEYDETCFNYQDEIEIEFKEGQVDERSLYQRTSVLKPINTDRIESWKEIFTGFQLKIIDFWCGKTGEKFGYKKTTKINLLESIAISIISFPYYIRVWGYFQLKSIKLNVYLSEVRKNNSSKGK